MLKALVAIDGSATSLHAVEHAIRLANSCPALEIVLLNVQAPVDSWELKSHLSAAEIEAMQGSRGGDALEAARHLLDAANVDYMPQVATGPVAETIVATAASHGCDGILLGSKGESFLAEIVLGSVAHDVLRLSVVPVTFIK